MIYPLETCARPPNLCACRSDCSTAVTVNKMIGTAEARSVSQSPCQPSATSPAPAFPAAACSPGQPGRCAGGHHGLGDHAPGQGHAQQTPPGGALGDQAGERGEERRQQHRQQPGRVQVAGVRPQHLDQVLLSLV
jgi:hypothetical protein